MRELVDQIESSLGYGHYFVSLYTALTIPDIAGALSSSDGEASGQKYISWFEEWVRPRSYESTLSMTPPEFRHTVKPSLSPITGDACYRFRCSLLHQGSSQHPKSPFSRIMFIEPGVSQLAIHNSTFNDALCIDLNLFCKEMISGARLWLDRSERTENYIKNYDRFVRRRPDGLLPYINGVSVIA